MTPSDLSEFKDICAQKGKRARCCVLPVLDETIVCRSPFEGECWKRETFELGIGELGVLLWEISIFFIICN